MLQRIHERVQGVIAWVLIILIAVTFTLWGINYYLEAHSASDVQVEVNGDKISKMDFSNSYQRLKHQAEQQTGELTPKEEILLKNRALKQLIFMRVVVQGAEGVGYVVTKEQAEQALMQIPQFQKDGAFSPEKFQQTLSSALYTPAIFLQKIQEGLMINQQRFSFAGTAFVLPEEINQFYGLARQTRDVNYVIIPESMFESSVQVSPEELQSYYDKNKLNFKMPEKVSIQYVMISMKDILSKTTVTNESLKKYYAENSDAYTRSAKWRWAHILIRVPLKADKTVTDAAHQKAVMIERALRQGEPFSQAAKTYSDDVLSASKGGMMPWVPESSVNPEILRALNSLNNNGVSEPIKTQYGYEIIQKTGYEPPQQIPFADVRAQIKDTLKSEKAQQVFADLGDDLTNLSYQDPSSLKETAKALDLPIKETPFFTRKGLSEGIASKKAVIQAAFSDEVLRDGNNSSVLAVTDDLLVVLRVKKHTSPSFISFDKVKKTINQIMVKEKAAIEARTYGEKLLNELKANPQNAVRLLKEKYALAWQTRMHVHRDDSTLPPVMLSTLFQMPPLENHQPRFQGVTIENGNYALLELTKVEQGVPDNLDQEEQKMFKDEIEAALGIIDYNLYVEGLMEQAKITEQAK